jgi:hypothetical protein
VSATITLEGLANEATQSQLGNLGFDGLMGSVFMPEQDMMVPASAAYAPEGATDMKQGTFTVLHAIACLLSAGSAQAALLAYDGFEAGGDTPGAGQYETGSGFVSSGLGAPGDALHNGDNNSDVGQGPTTTGFNAADPWDVTSPMGYADHVYFQASATPMAYGDGAGNTLNTLDGSVRHLHEDTPSFKEVWRPITDNTTPGDVTWYSFLLRIEAEDDSWSSEAELRVRQGLGTPSARYTAVGIDTDGNLRAYESRNGSSDTGSPLTEDADHLVVVRLEELAGIQDSMHVWLDPVLGPEPLLTSADASIVDDYLYVGNNANYPFDTLFLTAELDNSGSSNPEDFVFFDEFRLGTTWEDVTPFSRDVIPEPTTLSLLALGGLGLLRRRRRR